MSLTQLMLFQIHLAVLFSTQSHCRAWSLSEHLIQDYKNSDIPSINHVIDIFDWDNSFEGKNVHEQVHFLHKRRSNIFRNYFPNKNVLCDSQIDYETVAIN